MEQEESNTGNETSGASIGLWVGIGLVLLPIIYILSVGPAVRMAYAMDWPTPFIEIPYAPLIWVYENSDSFESFIDWYLRLYGL